jgi:hypothetical protein
MGRTLDILGQRQQLAAQRAQTGAGDQIPTVPKSARNYGFLACGPCTDTHSPDCKKVEPEIAEKYQLDLTRPDHQTIMDGVKKARLSGNAPGT